uniref:CID domain-containing protein n=1 Tax=Caenorhabditis tropicalis TaxID=1561998 RepID=A0A1I7URZ1_9PELO
MSDYVPGCCCEARRVNCFNAILKFENLIEHLTFLSNTHSVLFFSPVLNCVQKMKDLCVRAYEVQIIQNPGYLDELEKMTEEMHKMKEIQFEGMRRCLDLILHKAKGFRLEALLKIYKYWKVLEEMPLPLISNNEIEERHELQLTFMMGFRAPENHHLNTRESEACSSDDESYYEDDFLQAEDADFQEFEEHWRRMVEDGTSELNDDDLSPEGRAMLLEYRRSQAEHEENECYDADMEDFDEPETAEDLGSDEDMDSENSEN